MSDELKTTEAEAWITYQSNPTPETANAYVALFHGRVLAALERGDINEANAVSDRARLSVAYAYCQDAIRQHVYRSAENAQR